MLAAGSLDNDPVVTDSNNTNRTVHLIWSQYAHTHTYLAIEHSIVPYIVGSAGIVYCAAVANGLFVLWLCVIKAELSMNIMFTTCCCFYCSVVHPMCACVHLCVSAGVCACMCVWLCATHTHTHKHTAHEYQDITWDGLTYHSTTSQSPPHALTMSKPTQHYIITSASYC